MHISFYIVYCSEPPISKLRKLILGHNDVSDYAMYEILYYRLRRDLEIIYKSHNTGSEFADVMTEFYRYLRGELSERHYQRLEGIRSWYNFPAKIKSCFLKFLADLPSPDYPKLDRIYPNKREKLKLRLINVKEEREKNIRCLAYTITHLCSVVPVRDMLIFMGGLISKFCSRKVIGRKDLASLLGMTIYSYHQIETQTKSRAKSIFNDACTKGVLPAVSPEYKNVISGICEADDRSREDVLYRIYHSLMKQCGFSSEFEEQQKKDAFINNGTYQLQREGNLTIEDDEELTEVVIDFTTLSIRQRLINSFIKYCNQEASEYRC